MRVDFTLDSSAGNCAPVLNVIVEPEVMLLPWRSFAELLTNSV